MGPGARQRRYFQRSVFRSDGLVLWCQLHSLNNVRLGWSFGASRMYDELCQELFSRPPRLFVRIFLTHVSLHGQRWFFLGKAILY